MIDSSDTPGLDESAARLVALIETRIAPALERIAEALERSPRETSASSDGKAEAVAEIRGAIRRGEWPLAASLLADLGLMFPDAAEAGPLADELGAASRAAIVDRRARLDAARVANDPGAVLSYRDELAGLMTPEALGPLDKDVLAWVMALLMKRLRSGTVGPDLVDLASRVAESFPHRPEGASLRASLPTLRRSAGLCARCAGPYTGVEDACPKCTVDAPRIADLPGPAASAT